MKAARATRVVATAAAAMGLIAGCGSDEAEEATQPAAQSTPVTQSTPAVTPTAAPDSTPENPSRPYIGTFVGEQPGYKLTLRANGTYRTHNSRDEIDNGKYTITRDEVLSHRGSFLSSPDNNGCTTAGGTSGVPRPRSLLRRPFQANAAAAGLRVVTNRRPASS